MTVSSTTFTNYTSLKALSLSLSLSLSPASNLRGAKPDEGALQRRGIHAVPFPNEELVVSCLLQDFED